MKIFSILFLLSIATYAMDLDTFYKQVHTQAIQKNYIKFRGRILTTKEAYDLADTKERDYLKESLILIFSKIYNFIYFNEISGIDLNTEIESKLQFDIKYYETLLDIGIGGDIKAMCVLPSFDKCILLGYRAF